MAEDNSGLIFDLQRYSLHDGPGIRTLVFMKGCPLNCLWCSNPEAQNFFREIMFMRNSCSLCGNCEDQCSLRAIDPVHFRIDRTICDGCGRCVKACPTGAKKMVGEIVQVDSLLEQVDNDRIFYRNSGGGVTVSGGEPLLQYKFVRNFLRECRSINIYTAVETCGYAQWGCLENVLSNTDLLYFDLKHMDFHRHRQLTGVRNEIIVSNAIRAAKLNIPMIFRMPVIPGINDDLENLKQTALFVKELNCKLELLPYHSYGEYKYTWLGREYELKSITVPQKQLMEQYLSVAKGYGCEVEVIDR